MLCNRQQLGGSQAIAIYFEIKYKKNTRFMYR